MNFKKIGALGLSTAMMISMLAVPAFAANGDGVMDDVALVPGAQVQNNLSSHDDEVNHIIDQFDGTENKIDAAGDATTPIVLHNDALAFSVTVPTVLPVFVDKENTPHVAEKAKIINNCKGSIKVEEVTVKAEGWDVLKYEDANVTAMDNKKVDTKEYMFQLDGETVNATVTNGSTSTITLGSNLAKVILAKGQTAGSGEVAGETEFTYKIKTAPQSTENHEDSNKLGSVVFTLGWNK